MNTKILHRCCIAGLFLFLLKPCPAQQISIPRVDSTLNHYYFKQNFEGVLLVADQGKVLLEKSVGWADRQSTQPLSPSMPMPLGRATELFTSVLVLQELQAGRITLADPIGKHLYALPSRAVADLSIGQLLRHESGLSPLPPDATDEPGSLPRLLRKYLKPELQASAGYSSFDYLLLGMLLEQLNLLSLDQLFRERIAKPADLQQSGFLPVDSAQQAVPRAYRKKADGQKGYEVAAVPELSRYGAAAGAYSTGRDLYQFFRALRQRRLLKGDQLVLFWQLISSEQGSYRSQQVFHHYTHWIEYAPQQKRLAVLLCNNNGFDPAREDVADNPRPALQSFIFGTTQ